VDYSTIEVVEGYWCYYCESELIVNKVISPRVMSLLEFKVLVVYVGIKLVVVVKVDNVLTNTFC